MKEAFSIVSAAITSGVIHDILQTEDFWSHFGPITPNPYSN
jgi:hypothetical protein